MKTSHTPSFRSTARQAVVSALLAGIALTLFGCGGGADESAGGLRIRTIAPLLDDDGGTMPFDPNAEPSDAGARIRSQRYASREQAEMLLVARAGEVLQLTVDCCESDAVEVAMLTLYGLQAAHDLPASAPVLVDGPQLRLAARVVDGLTEAGMERVFLVTR